MFNFRIFKIMMLVLIIAFPGLGTAEDNIDSDTSTSVVDALPNLNSASNQEANAATMTKNNSETTQQTNATTMTENNSEATAEDNPDRIVQDQSETATESQSTTEIKSDSSAESKIESIPPTKSLCSGTNISVDSTSPTHQERTLEELGGKSLADQPIVISNESISDQTSANQINSNQVSADQTISTQATAANSNQMIPGQGITDQQAAKDLNPSAPTAAVAAEELPKTVTDIANQAATGAFNYDHKNYYAHFEELSKLFTTEGWDDFRSAMEQSGNLQTVIDTELTLLGKITAPAALVKHSVMNNTHYWTVQIPVSVRYIDSSNNESLRRYIVRVLIITVPTSVEASGYGIQQFVAMPDRDL